MTLIDNRLGVNLQSSGETPKSLTSLRDTHIYGETAAQDCPKGHNCICLDKIGFMLFGSNQHNKKFHIDALSPLPHYNIMSYGTWAAATDM